MFFHPASNGLIPLREKTVPASPADVIFAGVERATMRHEQFEIDVDADTGEIFISQDNGNGESADCVVLRAHQLPCFMDALRAAVAQATKAD